MTSCKRKSILGDKALRIESLEHLALGNMFFASEIVLELRVSLT